MFSKQIQKVLGLFLVQIYETVKLRQKDRRETSRRSLISSLSCLCLFRLLFYRKCSFLNWNFVFLHESEEYDKNNQERVDLRVEKVLAVSAEQKTGVWALFNPKMGPELFDSLSRTFFFDGEFGKRAGRKLSQNSGKRARRINLKNVFNTILEASTIVRKLYFSSRITLETKEILF